MSRLIEFNQLDSSFMVNFSSNLSASIFLDLKFQKLRTVNLQKGLIFIWNGREIVGEGVGFGVPVVKYIDDMYFSKDASLLPTERMNAVKKGFHMNGVEQLKIGRHAVSKDSFLGLAPRFAGYLYRSSAVSRKPMIKLNKFIKRRANVKSEFISVESRGVISVIYEVYPYRIHVSCDLADLDKSNRQRIFILNEQGSQFFTKYEDSDGANLVEEEIGAWERVKAKKACLSDFNSSFRFCLRNIDDAVMWLGRETHEDIAWAGLIYEISPKTDFFEYDIFTEY